MAETFVEGATVTDVARRYGASRSMVFSWRKRFRGEPWARPQPAFMPVMLAPPSLEAPPANVASDAPTIDVAFACGARLRVAGAVNPALVAGIVKALKRA